jgi:MFS transporter, DHA1 family, inner membrane transport protein
VLTLALSAVPRKAVLLILMTLFIAGNAIAAVAPSYEVLLAARLVTALCHGTFFGVGALIASAMVSKGRSAAAISTMFTSLTLATVLGVPFGSYVGLRFGWHVPFAMIAIFGIIALVGVWVLVPKVAYDRSSLGAELRGLFRVRIALAFRATAFGSAVVFTLFTYISPLLERVSGFPPSAVSGLLVLFGIGTVAGNLVAGRCADRYLPETLVATLLGLSAALGGAVIASGVALPLIGVAAAIAALAGTILAGVSLRVLSKPREVLRV